MKRKKTKAKDIEGMPTIGTIEIHINPEDIKNALRKAAEAMMKKESEEEKE